MLRFVITVSRRADSMRRFPSRCQGLSGGVPFATRPALAPPRSGSPRARFFPLPPGPPASGTPHASNTSWSIPNWYSSQAAQGTMPFSS